MKARPIKQATTAFCCIHRRQPISDSHVGMSIKSSEMSKDWFSGGRNAAKRLKEELGIDTNQDDTLDPIDKNDNLREQMDSRHTAMESGRSAARALLEQMNADVNGTEDIGDDPMGITSNCFDLRTKKSHCTTICMVPPPSSKMAWSRLTSARRACRDPGFYRWPPHANLLYPFIEPLFDSHRDSDEARTEEMRSKFMSEVAVHLSQAAEKCMPFDVTLNSFGTFGGKNRGVLWAEPTSHALTPDNNVEHDPLIQLQNELENQFPMCKDQKKQGSFTPHMTISHYANITDALESKAAVQSHWEPVSFRVSEVYLLERKGDNGQFLVRGTIPLGPGSVVKFHDPPTPFPDMPSEEEDWVLSERLQMKDRRKKSFKRKHRKNLKD